MHFGSLLRSPIVGIKFYTSPLHYRNLIFFKSKTLTLMIKPQSKRPTCPTCSKPVSLCLCTRIKNPNLNNRVNITVLQHSLEKKHPLNSARIVKLGLKNVGLFTVSDVNFEAKFVIQPLESGYDLGFCQLEGEKVHPSGISDCKSSKKRGFSQIGEINLSGICVENLDSGQFGKCSEGKSGEIVGFDSKVDAWSHQKSVRDGHSGEERSFADTGQDDHLLRQSDTEMVGEKMNIYGGELIKETQRCDERQVLNITLGKYGKIHNVIYPQMLPVDQGRSELESLILSLRDAGVLTGGFTVRKMQKQQKSGSIDLEEFEEFDISVPPGSALLFPAEKSVPIEDINFEVKNLIVLDGTWAKANRIYNENPWLKLLPCVRLNVEKKSLFNEVRHEPKPGYLSTLESVVYALPALGGNVEGLDDLLDVFGSMVQDQLRSKDERLRKASLS